MRKGFIKKDGLLLRPTKDGVTLYESVRISDEDVIKYIAEEARRNGLSPTKVITSMVSRYFYECVQKEEK